MSVNPDSDMISYSDHDVHHVSHTVRQNEGTGGEDLTLNSEEAFEITERGLDPDELAELRAMRVMVGVNVGAAEPQDSRGEISFDMGAGFNLNGEEFLQIGRDSKTVDPDNDATDELTVVTGDTDEVGQLWHIVGNVNIGFDDDTNGNGAGGGGFSSQEIINMDEMFGSGPYVDAADDFVSRIRFAPDNVIERVGVTAQYSLYYNVEEVEGGRTRFGR